MILLQSVNFKLVCSLLYHNVRQYVVNRPTNIQAYYTSYKNDIISKFLNNKFSLHYCDAAIQKCVLRIMNL